MLEAKLATEIMTAVDDGFDEQVNFTAELVKFPSRRGAEQTAQDFMAAALRERGLAVDRSTSTTSSICRASRPSASATTTPSTSSARIGRRARRGAR